MRAALVYNELAGTAASEESIQSALAAIDWRVTHRIGARDLDPSSLRGVDVVVVAGGDGTVGGVAKKLARTELPLAIVPMGTANNVARSIGLGVDPRVAVHGLADPVERRIDLGVVHRSGGAGADNYFLECVGVGVFADVIAEKATKQHKKLKNALALIADELGGPVPYEPPHFEIEIDGRMYSERFVLAAVMNIRSVGPALDIAPEAKCDDGELDVVLVRPDALHPLATHLRRAAEEGHIVLPAFETARAKRVRIRGRGKWAHVDDRPRELAEGLDIDVAPGALRLLVPRAPRGAPEWANGATT